MQVCYQLTYENKEREIKGLKEAMNRYNLNTGLLLTTDSEEQELQFQNGKINIMPVWKWLLG